MIIRKYKIFFIIILSILIGFVFGQQVYSKDFNILKNIQEIIFKNFHNKNQNNNKITKDNIKENNNIDCNFIKKVDDILKKKFLDTRKNKNKKITKKTKLYGAVNGLVESYGDPHTMFFSPEEVKNTLSDIVDGEFVGIGVEITYYKGFSIVVSPLPNSPAYKAGIRAKDLIWKVNGKKTYNMSPFEVTKNIKGQKGTIVELEILRKGEIKPIKIKIKRDIIKIPTVRSYIKDNVFIIKFYSFSKNSSLDFLKEIITKFKKSNTNKMILDLRGNTGGILPEGIFIAGLFLEKGKKIVKIKSNNPKDDQILVSGDFHQTPSKTTNIFNNLELIILTDEGTASASEILAGSLLDHKKAILLGEKTFGKGTVQELYNFDDGSMLKTTVAKFILPNGEWISHKGIEPDVKVVLSKEEWSKIIKQGMFSNYTDTQIKTAIALLNSFKDYDKFKDKVEYFSQERKKNKEQQKEEENINNAISVLNSY